MPKRGELSVQNSALVRLVILLLALFIIGMLFKQLLGKLA